MKNAARARNPIRTAAAGTLLALMALAPPAGAQAVYRCGNSYGQRPCEGGRVVEVDDARDTEQRTQAEQVLRRDAALGQQLEQGRLRDEARASAAMPALPALVPEPAVVEPLPPVYRARVHRPRKPVVVPAPAPQPAPGTPRNIQLPHL